ncbi:MAG: GntR family transcriptional regulator [Hyphomicrobiaceae bacterium]|nr:GntR family transcriptional regulator [Hyphomicrobiaceae bacterium]
MNRRSSIDADGKDLPRSIGGRITDQLRVEILRGDFAPGARVSIKVLSERFNVSLSPLREALTRLGSEGLLSSDEQRGFWIAPVSASDHAEVTRLRISFERMALQEAILKGGIEWETRVMAALYRMNRIDRSIGGAEAKEAWETAHRTFHVELLAACDMPLLLQFVALLHGLSDRYRRIFLASNPPDKSSALEHERIADFAVSRRNEEAVDLLGKHIERTGNAVRKKLMATKQTIDVSNDK